MSISGDLVDERRAKAASFSLNRKINDIEAGKLDYVSLILIFFHSFININVQFNPIQFKKI